MAGKGLNSGGTDACAFGNADVAATLIQSIIGVVTSFDHSCFSAPVAKQRQRACVCLVAVK